MLAARAITALESVCWELVDLDGKPAYGEDSEYQPHYLTEDEAWEAYAANFRYHDDSEDGPKPLWVPRSMDAPCLVLTTHCGYVLDQDGDGICHQNDREVLFEWAMGAGYILLDDGSMLCGPETCDDCQTVLIGEAPRPIVAPTLGQLTLDGREVGPDGTYPTVGPLPELGPLSPEARINLGALRRLDPERGNG